jgi:glycosyltransferase involved in cell wall biosynthesis
MCSAEEIEIVPNPIDPDQVVGSRSDADNGGLVTVGYLSGGTHRKGFDLLPQVMELVADLPVEWKLFLTRRPSPFSTPVWDRLDALDGVVLTIPGRKPDVREVYGQCDIVFLPSREESFSLITAEAMLNGLPVVATDLAPTRALLGDEAAGLLFPLDHVGQAAGALRRLVLEPSLRVRLGAEGRKRAAEFVPVTIADRMLRLYGIDGGSSPPRAPMPPGARHR